MNTLTNELNNDILLIIDIRILHGIVGPILFKKVNSRQP